MVFVSSPAVAAKCRVIPVLTLPLLTFLAGWPTQDMDENAAPASASQRDDTSVSSSRLMSLFALDKYNKMADFWVVAPCSLVEVYVWNVGKLPLHYTAQ
jgi:hypothetical protein